jgi:dephospho-CoA kinase
LGSSTQQAEADDIARQLNEKHAQDIASYERIFKEMEGQIQKYKRAQQLRHNDEAKENVHTQTDNRIEDEIEQMERELAAKEFQEEFGGCGETFLSDIKNLPDRQIVKRVREEWKTQRVSI